jgi:RimJ/RimL family protein N-acetyltransferase
MQVDASKAGATDAGRWMRNMKFQFRKVTPSDLNKFPLWYKRIDGPELFSNFIPTTFKTFEDSSVMLWFIIMDGEDEIGTIWFQKKNPDKPEIDLGIYLNRTDLFGKGIGRTLIKYSIKTFISKNDAEELYLDVRKENIRAIRCYEKSGFKAIQEGEKTTYYGVPKNEIFRTIFIFQQASAPDAKSRGV